MTQEINGVLTRAGGLEAMAELLAGLVGTASELRAWQVPFTPTPGSVEADFEAAEADFTGYAAVPLTWSDPGIDSGGRVVSLSNNAVFQATDADVPNQIQGVWVHTSDTGPPAVDAPLIYFVFPVPVSMATALAMFGFKTVLTLPDLDSYGVLEQ